MSKEPKVSRKKALESPLPFLLLVGVVGWFVPGGGYFILRERARAIIIFVAITATFIAGIYIGSIGVVDPIGPDPIASKLRFFVQIMNSPFVGIIGHFTAGGGYPVYGRPNEMGQIYTITAGLLNLLCIVNCVYLAHQRQQKTAVQ